MRRRSFIQGIAASTAWPFRARGAAGARPRIGILDINSAEYDERNIAAFHDGLQKLGYAEGKTVDIDYRYANGDAGALTALARELIALKPNVIMASAVSPTRAVKRVATSLPIVCPSFSDAFVPDLAASFAHPGGSVTGIATDVEGLFGKLTELTLDVLPGTTKIGFLANPAGGSMARFEQQVQLTARARGVAVQIVEVKQLDDLDGAFDRLAEGKNQAVIVPANGLLHAGQRRIIALATDKHLPLVTSEFQGVAAGGFASYGVDIAENHRRSAAFIDKILKGAAPGDLPIEFPTKLELVINLKTAKVLGLTVPSALLDRADKVIE
jgi:putative ABC transport system substrate-binding protein